MIQSGYKEMDVIYSILKKYFEDEGHKVEENIRISERNYTARILTKKDKKYNILNIRIDASPLSKEIKNEIAGLQEEGYSYIISLPERIKVSEPYVRSLKDLNIGLLHVGGRVKEIYWPEVIEPTLEGIKVFVSSIGGIPVRRKAKEVLQGKDFWMFHPYSYENWSGSSEPPEKMCMEKIDESDIFLGLLEEDVSTLFMKEVGHAIKKNKRILMLVRKPCPNRKKAAKDFLNKIKNKIVHLPFNNKDIEYMLKAGLLRTIRERIK